MTAVRHSEFMVRDGFMVMPFPAALSATMIDHAASYIGRVTGRPSFSSRSAKDLTTAVCALSDRDFISKFAKPLRIFPDEIGATVNNWVSGLAEFLGGSRSGINYISKAEQQANPSLKPTSFDVFWRCVRNGKPDVGRPHADFQFWEINRGTPLDPPSAFDYDERWKIWVPLMGCDRSNSLEVVGGSHREQVSFETIQTQYGTKPAITNAWAEANEDRFFCPLPAFEHHCVLFHDKLVHRGPGNNTKNVRLSAELTILLKL